MASLFYYVNLGLFYVSFMLDLFISDTYSWTWGWWPWCVECLPGLPCLLRGSRPALCSLPCWSLASCSAPALESALPRAHHPRYHLTYILHRACSVRIHTHALFMGGPIGAAGWWLVENKGRNQFTLGLLSSSFLAFSWWWILRRRPNAHISLATLLPCSSSSLNSFHTYIVYQRNSPFNAFPPEFLPLTPAYFLNYKSFSLKYTLQT